MTRKIKCKAQYIPWNFLNWAKGLNMEKVVLQWGCWRVMCRWGCRLGKGRSHTHALCPPRESCRTRQERCSSWAPRRWAYETLCCPPRSVCSMEGVRRVHPGYQSPRLELGACAPRSAIRRGTWGQGYIKGIGCPPSAWEGWDEVKGERVRG